MTTASPSETDPETESAAGASVEFEGVELTLGRRRVFDGLTARFPAGRVTVMLGGSGTGKSTLLRLVGGLTMPDAGRVVVDGRDMSDLDQSGLYDVRERIGMLFQGGALLDAMTIFDNVALPLREHTKLGSAEIRERVREVLDDVGLDEVEHLLPGQLSGGMNRRAALARAIVGHPAIVLCDEPFSGLDPINVRRIEDLLLELNRKHGLTTVVTSHHIPSAMRMADWIVFLKEGKAVMGTPAELRAGLDPGVTEFLVAEGPEYSDVPVRASGAGAEVHS